VQIIASDAFGGSDFPHPSQDGRSSSIRTPFLCSGNRSRGVWRVCSCCA